jgi:hypothetical protein
VIKPIIASPGVQETKETKVIEDQMVLLDCLVIEGIPGNQEYPVFGVRPDRKEKIAFLAEKENRVCQVCLRWMVRLGSMVGLGPRVSLA